MREEPSRTVRRPLPHVDASAALSQQRDTMRAMRRSLRIAAVLSSARALIAPVSRRSATRLMASASGAPEDETRGGTASLADQVARARTRVRKGLRARVERDGSVLRRESFLRCAAARGRRADRESTTVCLAASRREVEREHALRRREREAAHSRQKTHSSPKRKRTTTGATSTSRACLMGRRSRASGWRSRAAAAG